MSRDSSVGISTVYGWTVWVRFPAGARLRLEVSRFIPGISLISTVFMFTLVDL
jgi:hypothetical protein